MIKLNGKVVEFGAYPNGETLIKEPIFANTNNTIELTYVTDADLIRLMLVKRHLAKAPTHLTIRYMPYSRMDRVEPYGVFTLKHVADFINWLDFTIVTVLEPHSDVTCALLDRSRPDYFTINHLQNVVDMIGWDMENDFLFFPDAGAQKRYAKVLGYNTAVGFKYRDFATGQLSGEMDAVGFELPLPEQGKLHVPPKVLILDDLCSRGGTFVMAAKELRRMGAGEVHLFVAHCENTMWEGELLDHIDGLYCTDSILSTNLPHDGVHVYSEGKWS